MLNARPDGYTIAQIPITLLRYPHMQKVNWDPFRDFTRIIGIKCIHVPFKGNADATASLMGGHISASADSFGWAEHIQSGRFRRWCRGAPSVPSAGPMCPR